MPEGTELGGVAPKIVVDDKPMKSGKPPLLVPFATPAAEPIKIKKVAIVYNPVGGRKKAQKLVDTIVLPMLKEASVEVVLHKTTHAGHEAELGKTLDLSGVDALLAMGGDGTCSSLLSGFLQRPEPAACAVGFLPAGTGNTYMREVLGEKTVGGCASGMRAAMRAVLAGRTRRVDVLKCAMTATDGKTPLVRYALNTVMLGFGPDANAVAEKRRWLGSARYAVSIKTEILKLPCRKSSPCTMALDAEKAIEMDLFLIALMNNKHTGVKHRRALSLTDAPKKTGRPPQPQR